MCGKASVIISWFFLREGTLRTLRGPFTTASSTGQMECAVDVPAGEWWWGDKNDPTTLFYIFGHKTTFCKYTFHNLKFWVSCSGEDETTEKDDVNCTEGTEPPHKKNKKHKKHKNKKKKKKKRGERESSSESGAESEAETALLKTARTTRARSEKVAFTVTLCGHIVCHVTNKCRVCRPFTHTAYV